MFNVVQHVSSSVRARRVLGGALLAVLLVVAGCGVVGGGGGEDDGDDGKYPEPPGRPNATAVHTPPTGMSA